MRLFWYFIDVLNAIGTSLMEAVAKNTWMLIFFIPFIAFMIPIFIWMEERRRKGKAIDYRW